MFALILEPSVDIISFTKCCILVRARPVSPPVTCIPSQNNTMLVDRIRLVCVEVWINHFWVVSHPHVATQLVVTNHVLQSNVCTHCNLTHTSQKVPHGLLLSSWINFNQLSTDVRAGWYFLGNISWISVILQTVALKKSKSRLTGLDILLLSWRTNLKINNLSKDRFCDHCL